MKERTKIQKKKWYKPKNEKLKRMIEEKSREIEDRKKDQIVFHKY